MNVRYRAMLIFSLAPQSVGIKPSIASLIIFLVSSDIVPPVSNISTWLIKSSSLWND